MDPAEKDALLSAGGAPVKARATVQVLGSSAVVSVPLGAYRAMNEFARLNGAAAANRGITVTGRILAKDGSVAATFEDTVPPASSAPVYLKTIPLTLGAYRLELAIKDVASGNTTPETLEFQVR
jgi:hypothetical protein